MHRAVKFNLSIALAAATAAAVVAVAPVGAHPPFAVRAAAGYSESATTSSPKLAAEVSAARNATERYATNLSRAKAAGYGIITRMIPDMGYHFLNPKVTSFDVRKPMILVYEHSGHRWHLGALEWVFTSKPAKSPLPGARYGVFGAACHYVDGTFVFADAQSKCPAKSPQTHAAFNFWHPRLITLHVWVWYPNPAGLFMGTNPLVAPFNRG
jgi:hypothetical protein